MNTFTTISISLNVNGVLDLENSFTSILNC